MVKAKKQPKPISNRRARFDYELKEDLVVGIQLTGVETRAVRHGQIDLKGSYVTIKDNELWLTNATISGSNGAEIAEEAKTRSRKLLANAREIKELIEAKDKGQTIVPLDILNRGKYIKVRIATGVGRKKYDKRNILKERDTEKSINRYEHRRNG